MTPFGGQDEFPAPATQQIVFAHDAMNPLGIYLPTAPPQFGGDPWPPVVRHLERDSLYRVPQIHVAFGRLRIRIETVETSATHSCQLAHALNGQFLAAHFLPDLLVDSGFPVNACSIRCSSMRCKHRFKKSISNACCPIFRSNSATRFSSALFLSSPGKACSGDS